jgi:hypothetical protein
MEASAPFLGRKIKNKFAHMWELPTHRRTLAMSARSLGRQRVHTGKMKLHGVWNSTSLSNESRADDSI